MNRQSGSLDKGKISIAKRSSYKECSTPCGGVACSVGNPMPMQEEGDYISSSSNEFQEERTKKFHGCFSTSHVQEVIATFGKAKLSVLSKLGLSSLAHLRPSMNHSRFLVCWLLRCIDTAEKCLRLEKGSPIELTNESVERILGVRSEGKDIVVSSKVGHAARERLYRQLRTMNKHTLPTLDDARKVFVRHYDDQMSPEEEERFAVALAIYVCAYMFGPVTRIAIVIKDVLEFISVPSTLWKCNWAQYTIRVAINSATRIQQLVEDGQETNKHPFSLALGGCWLYFELLYHDNLDFGTSNIAWSLVPRIRYYEKKTIREFRTMDEYPPSSGIFGKRERRFSEDGTMRGSAYNHLRKELVDRV